MISRVYIESDIRSHPRTEKILEQLPQADTFEVDEYQEVFNRKSQDFRLQKKDPGLILAQKHDNFVLETPEYCELGDDHDFYYFSHMMNCVYDCRYCFLQGMYDSAHYVVFVNFDDFFERIAETAQQSGSRSPYFFSGHVNDSLALDQVTGFSGEMLPFFRELDDSYVELRTKSVQIDSLLDRDPFDRCIVAWSMTPPDVSRSLEHKTPPVRKRLEAMRTLQDRGWRTGLRIDPLIYSEGFREQYGGLFDLIFEEIRVDRLHSVTLGPFRLPEHMHKDMRSLYPEEELFASNLDEQDGVVSYEKEIETDMMTFCRDRILEHVPEDRFHPSVDLPEPV